MNVERKRGGCLVALLLLLSSVVGAQSGVLAVSKPPAQVVPSDPPQGLIFELPLAMSASSVAFDSSGGPQSLGYLHFGADGDGYLSFDDGPDEAFPGGIMVIERFLERDGFDPERDRLITGAAVGLVAPKDLVVVSALGIVIIADFAEAKLATFDLEAAGNQPPLFVVTDLGTTAGGEARRPWGLDFDSAADRLFVGGTDGTVLVYDDFLVDRGERGPDRVITPTLGGEKISANTHDVVYLVDRDLLMATDVGPATTPDAAGFDSDGRIFVLERASGAVGDTEVLTVLGGPETLLGNPVGAAYGEGSLFVSERTKDVVLRFDGILELAQRAQVAPSAAVTVAQPEGVVLLSELLGTSSTFQIAPLSYTDGD